MEIFKTIVVTVLPCVVAIITTVISVIKIVTKGKVDLQITQLSDYQKMYDKLKSLVKEAEDSYNSMKNVKGLDAGKFKKNYVITKLQLYAVANNIKFDENLWCMYLEDEIGYTNKVNVEKSTRVDKVISENENIMLFNKGE
jgi:ABC-type microcin C transport system permease subunit YejB